MSLKPGEPYIIHMFRAIGFYPFPEDCGAGGTRPRGNLTVAKREGSDKLFVYFDYTPVGMNRGRVTGEYTRLFFFGKDGKQADLPEGERELGKVKMIAFSDCENMEPEDLHTFELYNRFPVPPKGSKVSTASASVVMKTRAVG